MQAVRGQRRGSAEEPPSPRAARRLGSLFAALARRTAPCARPAAAVPGVPATTPVHTAEEVATHSTEDDCWLIIEGKVYDVTPFLRSHPGGILPITDVAGQDATAVFNELHNPAFLDEFGRNYQVGVLAGSPAAAAAAEPPTRGPAPRRAKLFVSPNPRAAPVQPKAARWLAARYVPRDEPMPLSLRPLSAVPGASSGTGLHVLEPQHWIELDRDCFAAEMAKKRKLLLEPENRWYDNIFQAEPDTRAEQAELLEVLIDNLLTHHADDYKMKGREITVVPTGDTYNLDDWVGKSDASGRPIEIQLASLLVQEEFYLLRRNGRMAAASQVYTEGQGVSDTGVEAPYLYEFCAGTSCLNFIRAGIKGERVRRRCFLELASLAVSLTQSVSMWQGLMAPNNPMHTIHRPVPGMAEHGWHRKLAHIFSAMDERTAYYRTNFGLDRDNRNTYYLDENNDFQSEEGVAAEYGEGTTTLAEFRNRGYDTSRPVDDVAFMASEFQSMHRLPKTHALVFTLHKYFCSLRELRQSPEACAMLLRALEATPEDKMEYQLGEDPVWREALLEWLREVSADLP